MTKPIYLDTNATTPHDPAVIEAMLPYLREEFGNPSSSHSYGLPPAAAVKKARQQVADLINCSPDEIIFTSGGTESNNHAIKATAFANRERGNHIITSVIEHPAVLKVCEALKDFGFTTTLIPVDRHGRVNPQDIEKALRPETILISIMHSNNEVGTLQPISEISDIAKAHSIVMHTDAAQSVGKVSIDVRSEGVDLLSIAGHKLYAPKGIGALYIRKSCGIDPWMHGAGQEQGRRAGTENVLGIVGLGAACELAARDRDGQERYLRQCRDRLSMSLTERFGDSVRVNGHPSLRLPNTLSISFYNLSATAILQEIRQEIAASAGAACHGNSIAISHVLKAMEVSERWASGTLRLTTGRMTTLEEIDRAVHRISEAIDRLRSEESQKIFTPSSNP